jgi:Pyridoxamine 5'-phosphate oxidase
MGQQFPALTEAHRTFIEKQRIFFVASAAPEGRVNLSPKGMDTLVVLGPNEIAYLDVTGSGNETAAHLRASPDGRLTLMFCAFEGAPIILRLYGRGTAHARGSDGYRERISHFTELPGARQIVVLAVDLVQTSCGMAVPCFEFREQRENLNRWAEARGPEGLKAYWTKKNMMSIDGLPTGMDPEAVAKP